MRITSVRITRFRQQAPRRGDRFALRMMLHPIVHIVIHTGFAFDITEDTGRNRPLRGDAAAIAKNRNEFLIIERDGNGLTQLARALSQSTDHRVLHVETHIANGGGDGGNQMNAFLLHIRCQSCFALRTDFDCLIESVGADTGSIVIPLEKFIPIRNIFFFQAIHRFIDERNRLARIRQQASCAIARLARARITLAVEIGISHQHHLPIRVVNAEHIGAGADRIPIQHQVFLPHARLRIKMFGLPRHRREKRHRQPIQKLRILALESDAIGIPVQHLGPGQRIAVEIEISRAIFPPQALILSRQQFAVFLEPQNVIRHQTEDRRIEPRMREALDLVNVIIRGQFARAGIFEIIQALYFLQLRRTEMLITQASLRITRERRMRLIENAGANMNHVLAHRDL